VHSPTDPIVPKRANIAANASFAVAILGSLLAGAGHITVPELIARMLVIQTVAIILGIIGIREAKATHIGRGTAIGSLVIAGLLVLMSLGSIPAWISFVNFERTNPKSAHGGAKMRELLLPDLKETVNDIRKIRFREKDQSLELEVKDGEWRVQERGDYPASYDKIHRVLMSLLDMKITGKQVAHKNSLSQLKLVAPADGTADQTGMEMDLINGSGGNVATLIIGGTLESSGGTNSGSFMGGPAEQRFIRLPKDDTKGKDEYTAWQVSDSLYDIQPDPKQAPKAEDWIDKSFIDVKKVHSVAITHPNAADSWTGARADENAEFKFEGAKPGEELDTAKANGLASVLSSAGFTDVVPKDKVTPDMFKGSSTAEIKTFEGFKYDVTFAPKAAKGATEPEAYYFKVKVSGDFAKERKADPKEKPEDKKKNDDKFAEEKTELDKKLTKEKAFEGWVYEVSSSTVTALVKKKSEVLREKAADKPAATPPGATPPPFGAIPCAASPVAPSSPPPAPPHTTTVTTPPVTVPAPPAEAKPAPAPKPEAPKPEAPKPADAKPAEAKPTDAKP